VNGPWGHGTAGPWAWTWVGTRAWASGSQ